MQFKEGKSGRWFHPKKKGYLVMCCDCGLAHEIDFKVVPCGKGHKVMIKVIRNDRVTKTARKKYGLGGDY